MTLVDDLRAMLPPILAIPGTLGMRRFRVFLQQGSYSGAFPGEGDETVSELELLEATAPPKVRTMNDRVRALRDLPTGTVEVGPITPVNGTPIADLIASGLQPGDTFHVRILDTEANVSTHYAVTQVDRNLSTRVMLTAVPVR